MYRFGKPKIVLTLLFLFVAIAAAQEGLSFDATIKGQVLDTTPEQNPIPDVTVSIVGTDGETYVVYTNNKGEYIRTGLHAGRYTISYSKDGYGNRVGKTKLVAAGGEIFDRVKMRKKENILTFLMKNPFGWILFVGAAVVMIIVFILLFLSLRN
ncbi:carboxypeptidase regulatory-like domain-containing protein [Candidatus Poribacteria bacterium]|nr:carboxypeptidase regulatory-like domain-containing protein [Candidatus Poribacteria bacterium]MYB63185.1 carboxypeptidase regulatory-like domain-containing protein [Candidatus Poribacteria bacterium]MYF57326.1 carboxypeptidase regulatory-like domain-containing protein [Candidatus Poribacteria bacterium]MYI93101.1 carboxypeptidase regulatory-like domain-containing protein [Candidatus Poribacteria bacterium]